MTATAAAAAMQIATVLSPESLATATAATAVSASPMTNKDDILNVDLSYPLQLDQALRNFTFIFQEHFRAVHACVEIRPCE
jgi:hypothetical protein